MIEKLPELVKRRHPRYEEKLPHWDFVEATYEGGREWFKDNIFRYMKEGDTEYDDRVKRAYRFNHTKQVVDVVDKYLFKMPIARRVKDAPESVQTFWKCATRSGLDMDTFARRISNASSRFGRVYVVVDSSFTTDAPVVSLAERKKQGGGPYAYIVRPQDMLDIAYDEYGIVWALVREVGRDDQDPFTSSGKAQIKYRLWTREGWYLIAEHAPKRKGMLPTYEIEQAETNELGVVPIVHADHQFNEEPYECSGLIDDIAYLDRANANYLSNLDAIIQDQTFSQLTMPAQGVLPGDDAHDKLVEAGTKRVFTYNGEAGHKPEYISPDPRQASMILSAIGKIINEIYHSVGLSGERTKDDNGGGIDNSSGVAKAYDFERINSLLTSKAATLEAVENQILRLVALWEGQIDKIPDESLVVYPEKFDTRSLYDEFEIATRLSLLAAPDEVRRDQMMQVIEKLFPSASSEERKKYLAALKSWPPEPVETAQPGLNSKNASGKTPGGAAGAAVVQKTAKEMAS